jgi:hypothetical protein
MSGLSRREFCTSAALGAICWGVAGCLPEQGRGTQKTAGGGFEIPSQALDSVEYRLTMADFRAQVGTRFTVATASGSSVLSLAAVKQGRPASARGEAFACVFEPTDALSLSQDTYQTRHAKLGTFSLFLVPLAGPDPVALTQRPVRYVASFNRA